MFKKLSSIAIILVFIMLSCIWSQTSQGKNIHPVYYYIYNDPFASLEDIMHLVCPLYPDATNFRVGDYLYDLNPGKLRIFPLDNIKIDNQGYEGILVIGNLPDKNTNQRGLGFYIIAKVNRELKIIASLDEIYPEPTGKIRLLDEPAYYYLYDHNVFALGFFRNELGTKAGTRVEEVIWYRIINERITEIFRYERELYELYYDGFHDRQSYSTLDLNGKDHEGFPDYVMYTVSYIIPNDNMPHKPSIKIYNCTWNGKYYEKKEIKK